MFATVFKKKKTNKQFKKKLKSIISIHFFFLLFSRFNDL